jgi:hypothetical protein
VSATASVRVSFGREASSSSCWLLLPPALHVSASLGKEGYKEPKALQQTAMLDASMIREDMQETSSQLSDYYYYLCILCKQ